VKETTKIKGKDKEKKDLVSGCKESNNFNCLRN
jgi:hypothetical protein